MLDFGSQFFKGTSQIMAGPNEIIYGLKNDLNFAFLSWPVGMDLKIWCYEIRIAFSFDLRSVGRSLRDVRRRRRRGRRRKRGEKKSFQRSTSNLSLLWKKLWEREVFLSWTFYIFLINKILEGDWDGEKAVGGGATEAGGGKSEI